MKDRFRNINLDVIPGSSEDEFRGVLYDFAGKYCELLGVNFVNDVLPHLNDKDWWEADYGQASRDGKSIGMSAKDALRCLVDTHRTFQIYKGLEETIKELKDSGKNEIIGIDAGTGTGILAITMVSLGVDKVYAIEINKETFGVTQKFLKELKLTNKVKLIQGDATLMDIPLLKGRKADILVSENLSGGLLDEPQYDIINHLSEFLSSDAEILPGGAELYVSLASVDWEGTPSEKNNLAARRLRRCDVVSPKIKYSQVDSKVGMFVPIIESQVAIPTEFTGAINALLISTRFRINNLGKEVYLEPDTADFLGKTSAFKLNGDVYAQDGLVNVSLKYEAGRERENLKVSTKGNNIIFVDTMLKG